MQKLVLFDMDGTLTPPRKKMNWQTMSALTSLQRRNYEIGIITGSGMDYIKQQCDIMWDLSPIDHKVVHYLPCNGTKYYLGLDNIKWDHDMKLKVGEKGWQKIMALLIESQANLVKNYPEIPLTGNFIQARGSMINWAPAGRQAKEERKQFIALDKKFRIRELLIHTLQLKFASKLAIIRGTKHGMGFRVDILGFRGVELNN